MLAKEKSNQTTKNVFVKTENYFLSESELAGKIDQYRPSEKSLVISLPHLKSE